MEGMDKEDIIQQLLQLEEVAEKITLQMEDDKKKLPDMIAEKENAIKEEMEKKTKEDVAAIHDKAFDDSRNKITEISIAAQKMFAALEKEYDIHAQEWQEAIFAEIIGR